MTNMYFSTPKPSVFLKNGSRSVLLALSENDITVKYAAIAISPASPRI